MGHKSFGPVLGVNDQIGKQKTGKNQWRCSHQSSPFLPRDLSEGTGEPGREGQRFVSTNTVSRMVLVGALPQQPCAGGFLLPLVGEW